MTEIPETFSREEASRMMDEYAKSQVSEAMANAEARFSSKLRDERISIAREVKDIYESLIERANGRMDKRNPTAYVGSSLLSDGSIRNPDGSMVLADGTSVPAAPYDPVRSAVEKIAASSIDDRGSML